VSQTRPGPKPARSTSRPQRDDAPRVTAASARTAPAAPTASLASRVALRAPRPNLGGGGAIGGYFRDVRSELRKVVWPSREEATKLTAVVIGLSVIVGLYLGLLDLIFSELVRLFVRVAGG